MDIFSLIALSKAKNAESKSIGVYHYKGSVETASALPSQGNVQGDVWNIVDTSTYGPAGTNVAWDGVAWDALGGMAPVTSVNSQTGAVVLSASDVGAIAAPSSPATGAFLVYDGSAWGPQTLATWQGGNY